MRGTRVVAVVLAALGVSVLIATWQYPHGAQGVPGPAMAPAILAVALLLIVAGLLRERATDPGVPGRQGREIAVTAALLVAYVAAWPVTPYWLRTAALLIAFLRITGLSWRAASIAACLLAGSLVLVFEHALAVRF